jgi:hypothetical protein
MKWGVLAEDVASSNKVRILIEHPHSYREWKILCKGSAPGFFHLESRVRLDQWDTTVLEFCLHESQFERI